MSYELIARTDPVARKDYRCIWCPDKILKGERHVHDVSKYCGDFQDHRWHPECKAASDRFFRTSGEEEFQAHEFKRGTEESA